MNAVKFGAKYQSCKAAMKWRKSLPVEATQADAYLECPRVDWVIWQLLCLPDKRLSALRPALEQAGAKMIARALRRALKKEKTPAVWRKWARAWLSGKDRSQHAVVEVLWTNLPGRAEGATEAAVTYARLLENQTSAIHAVQNISEQVLWGVVSGITEARVWNRVWDAESRRQTNDIRAFIPKWPGE
jgi:hypothetical protein